MGIDMHIGIRIAMEISILIQRILIDRNASVFRDNRLNLLWMRDRKPMRSSLKAFAASADLY